MVTTTRSAAARRTSLESMGSRSCEKRPRSRQAAPVVQQRIVRQGRADAGEDGIVIVTELLDMRAGALAGDPAPIVVGRGNLSV